VLVERTSVGLDVHARSVVAAAIDGVTGELLQARLTPSHDHIRSWIGTLTGPVAVAYEAGPTGFDSATTTMAFESDYETVLAVTARRNRLDDAIAELAGDSEFTPIVRRLGCLRGVSTLTAFALAVEIGDWHRFTGNSIGSFVGLVPSEHSSGASRVQGSVTKTGNGHARRLLVEAAWHHRARYAPGKTMRDRWQLAPPAARDRGDAGNRRLHARWVEFTRRRKRPVIANVAIARELAGWCWSLAVID